MASPTESSPAAAGSVTLSTAQFQQLIQTIQAAAGTATNPSTPGTSAPASAVATPTDSSIIVPKGDWTDISSKVGRHDWQQAITRPAHLGQLSASLANGDAIINRFEAISIANSWREHLQIPTAGSGALAATSTQTPGGTTIASFEFTEHKDLIKDLNSFDEAIMSRFASFVFGDLTQGLSARTDKKLTIKRLNLQDTVEANRLAAIHKYRLRVISRLIYSTLENHMTKTTMDALLVSKAKFQFTCEETGKVHYDGFMALYLILSQVKPATVVDIETLRKKMDSMKLCQFHYNVRDMFTAFQDTRQKMIAEKGAAACDDSQFLTYLFKALATSNNTSFHTEVSAQKRAWSMGRAGYTTPQQIIDSLTLLYKNLVAEKEWGKTSDASTTKLLAMTTQVSELEKQLKAQDAALVRLKDSSTALTTLQDKDKDKVKLGSWRTTKVGESTKHPATGEVHKWCNHHGKHGCYMPADHDHDAWVEKKKSRAGGPDKKRQDPKSVSFADHPKKLKLSQKLKSALVTGMYISEPELDDLMKSVDGVDDAQASLKD
eukprot:scaffold13581_cov72-Skeletonema_dohrnii-CCMP3373.AAC.2